MLRTILQTDPSLAPLLLRLALGAVIFPHGAQKALGWFGGPGVKGTLVFFRSSLRIPAPLALLAIAAEFLGSLALVVGLGGRVAALAVGAVMAVAALTVHRRNGFFMNWMGNQRGEGFEYHLLAIGIALALVVTGSGAFSLDQLIAA